MTKEIMVIPRDVRSHELNVRNQRLQEKAKFNIENVVRSALSKIGALKISFDELNVENDKATIMARFDFDGQTKRAQFNLERDKFANWRIKEFQTSIDAAIVEAKEHKIQEVKIPNDELIIDLSVIKAVQRGNSYYIEHPVIGKIGTLTKEEITEPNIKTLFALFANETGAKIKYINGFAVDFKDESYDYEEPTYRELESKDPQIQAKNQMTYYIKAKTLDMNASVRENFSNIIKIEAQNFIKRNCFSYKTGPVQILGSDSFVEINNGEYNGNVVVKAKIGQQEKVFALPVEKGRLTVKKDINAYIIEEKVFEDIVKNKIEERLKAMLKEDMELIVKAEKDDIANLQSNINAIRTQDVLKTFKVAKINLEGVEVGDVINLSGIKYKVEPGTNDAYFNLVLVNE